MPNSSNSNCRLHPAKLFPQPQTHVQSQAAFKLSTAASEAVHKCERAAPFRAQRHSAKQPFWVDGSVSEQRRRRYGLAHSLLPITRARVYSFARVPSPVIPLTRTHTQSKTGDAGWDLYADLGDLGNLDAEASRHQVHDVSARAALARGRERAAAVACTHTLNSSATIHKPLTAREARR